MATEIVKKDNGKSAADLDYWTRHAVPVLSSLLKSAGSYSPADQEAQLRLLSEHVLPNLGPRPSAAHTRSFITQSGSPFQPSINLSSGRPQLRYCWELLGPRGGSDSDPFAVEAAREILASLAGVLGFCTQWSDAFLSAFAPTPEEVRDVQVKLPKWLASLASAQEAPTVIPQVKRLPFVFVAFDLSGPKASMKAYMNPRAKEVATGISTTDLTWSVLRSLTPAFDAASIDMVAHFLSERPTPSTIELVGIDCVDEASLSGARVKLYAHAGSNSFNTLRDYVTLGGRLQDETTLKGLAMLRDVWHLLLQEPEGVDDDYNKPVNNGSGQKLYFSFEIRPGRALPEVKTYLPTWNYLRSDAETVQNYEQILRKCGHEWGDDSRYRKAFERAFGPANHNRETPVHCEASFQYSENKGAYQTLYFSPPLGEE